MNFVVLPEDLQLLQRIEFTDASGTLSQNLNLLVN